MSVPVQTPVASFAANGITTVFPYAYLLLSSGDLQVTLDGVVLTSGFTISGVGSVTGGNVTFAVAPASGTLILRRKMSLSRLVDYVEAGDLLASTLNLDLDRIWMVMQGLQSDATRSIKLPEETLTDQTITDDAATRASKLLGFDVLGNVTTLDVFDPTALIVTTYIETLLSAANSVSARSILEAAADNDVVKLTGTQTVAGVKTFSSSPVLPGNASTALQAVPKQQLDALLPAGAVAHFAMSFAPSGWLKADGSAVSRTAYAALFAAIGTTFGAGDGSTTFNLPDLRGEFIRCWDDARAVDTGRVFGSAQSDEIKLHGHQYRSGTASVSSPDGTGGFQRDGSNATNYSAYTGTPSATTGQQIGGAGGTETRPRNIALLACIKI